MRSCAEGDDGDDGGCGGSGWMISGGAGGGGGRPADDADGGVDGGGGGGGGGGCVTGDCPVTIGCIALTAGGVVDGGADAFDGSALDASVGGICVGKSGIGADSRGGNSCM